MDSSDPGDDARPLSGLLRESGPSSRRFLSLFGAGTLAAAGVTPLPPARAQAADESRPPDDVVTLTGYLNGDGNANSRRGDGTLTIDRPDDGADSDAYTYDPFDPTPTTGGPTLQIGATSGGVDQRPVEDRNDVPVFTSAELPRPFGVVGTPEVTLCIESTAPDTDFGVKLVDVRPDGYAANIAEGISERGTEKRRRTNPSGTRSTWNRAPSANSISTFGRRPTRLTAGTASDSTSPVPTPPAFARPEPGDGGPQRDRTGRAIRDEHALSRDRPGVPRRLPGRTWPRSRRLRRHLTCAHGVVRPPDGDRWAHRRGRI